MLSRKNVTIADRAIGPGHPPYVVAEMSGNHKGDFKRALALIEAAAEVGADAIKLQTYTADTITINHDSAEFTINGGLWNGRKMYDLYEEAHTPWEWHADLFKKGHELGIDVFSSPFDPAAVDLLSRLCAPAYKIASFEMVDHPLIERCAAQGMPIIISSGMANKMEIAEAVEAANRGGCQEIILLHCVSGYPSEPEDANLRTIQDLADSFDVVPGLSDHTHGISVSVAAVALGACFIEKHFTLSRADGGPDAAFSLEPCEFRELVDGCRTAWEALGRIHYDAKGSERSYKMFRRSLYVTADIAAGEILTENNIRSIRPGLGMAPKLLPRILGRRTARDLRRGEPLTWEMVEDDE